MWVLASTRGLTYRRRPETYARQVDGRSSARTWTWRDALVPAALLVLGAVELLSLRTEGWAASIGLEAVAAAALSFRRQQALAAALVAAIALGLIPVTGAQMNDAAAPILFYVLSTFGLGRWMTLRVGVPAMVAVLATVFAQAVLVDPRDQDFTDVVFVLALGLPPFVFGRIVRRLDEQNRVITAQQETIRDQAVRAERDRIARELHDVVAHSVSAMVVQTAAAQDLVRTDPDRAAELLASIAETGRNALAETGRLLHVVRDEADELGLAPAPGLADVSALVDAMRERGLDVAAALSLPGHPLPGGVDVSAYRLVQEALTNALRYGDGAARLEVTAGPQQLRIHCSNGVAAHPQGSGGTLTLSPARTSVAGSGLGLQGMAERVAILGGTLRHELVGGNRFEVEATIPLGGAS
jgi:signal transduction histidine kinase